MALFRKRFILLLVFVVIIRSFAADHAGELKVVVRNFLNSSVYVCTNVALGSFPLGFNKTQELQLPDDGRSLVVFACDLGDSQCIKCQNPRATMAEFKRTSNGDISYSVSAENGYNIRMDIRPLGGSGCRTISCAGNLNKCPEGLRNYNNSTGAVVGCNSPDDCFMSEQQCSTYFSMVAKSQCEIPSSSGISHDRPSGKFNCLASMMVDLVNN